MREFFRGWKRKVGCLTLALACIFAAAWIRSIQIFDRGRIPVQEHTWIEAESRSGRLYLSATYHGQAQATFEWRTSDWISDAEESRIIPRAEHLLLHFLGIGVGAVTNPAKDWIKKAVLILPYWSIVLFFTLLSAGLLLSDRRAKKIQTIESPPRTEP